MKTRDTLNVRPELVHLTFGCTVAMVQNEFICFDIILVNMFYITLTGNLVFRPAGKARKGNKQKCLCHFGSQFFSQKFDSIIVSQNFCACIAAVSTTDKFVG